jgi:hypothetical protein
MYLVIKCVVDVSSRDNGASPMAYCELVMNYMFLPRCEHVASVVLTKRDYGAPAALLSASFRLQLSSWNGRTFKHTRV